MPAEVAVLGATSALIKVLSIIPKLSFIFNLGIFNPSATIEDVKKWFIATSVALEGTDGRGNGMPEDREQEVRELAFEIQDAIHEYMYANPEHSHHHLLTRTTHSVVHPVLNLYPLWRLSSRMKDIKHKFDAVEDRDETFGRRPLIPSHTGSTDVPSYESHAFHGTRQRDSVDDESFSKGYHHFLESMKEHKDKLHHLVSSVESKSTIVISVIGDPGSGMTPLICGVCAMVKETFQYYDFVTVPRSLDSFSKIINKLLPLLEVKKYLLVVDGICTIKELNYLKSKLFPVNGGNNKGSRIIISTCNRKVANCYPCSEKYTCDLNSHPLTWERAWELFCKITFEGGICPDVLDRWSRKIVKKCELSVDAIVVVGNFLSNTTRTVDDFKNLHDSLVDDPKHPVSRSCHRFFSENYNSLSSNHKSLFLYFSIFPGDGFVKRGRLIRLCIGEGFIEENKVKSLHQVAEEDLDELVKRGLVQVTRSYSEGRAGSFGVSDLARGFILSEIEEDRFCTVLESSQTSLVGEKTRRLSLHSCWPINSQGKDLSLVRTFSVFGVDSSVESMDKLFTKFKLLTVLDLENADLQHFPEQVVNLILLRYLSLRNTKIDSVPKSIKKLLNLLTVDLRQTRVSKLHKKILKLHKLLYLFVGCQGINNDEGAQVCPEIGSLMTSLQMLSNIKANYKGKSIVKELKNLAELRKLGITELKDEDGQDFCASIENMKHLTSLYVNLASENEYLKLDFEMKPLESLRSLFLGGMLETIPRWVRGLSSLSKLKLKGSKLQNSPLEALQALPSLKELYLYDAYNGPVLKINALSFLELKTLEIEQCSQLTVVFLKVTVPSGVHPDLDLTQLVPKLQKLTVKNCGKLSKVYKTKKLDNQLEVHVPLNVRVITEE